MISQTSSSWVLIIGVAAMVFGCMIADWDDPRSRARSSFILAVGNVVSLIGLFMLGASAWLLLFFVFTALFFLREWQIAKDI